jgi:hypothetical protein
MNSYDCDKIIKRVLIISLDSQTEEMHGVESTVVKGTRWVGETGRCIVPCLFNLCKLIDKFQNLLFYCFDKYWNEYEYLAYIDCIN